MNMILSRPLSGLMTMRAGSRRIFATALGAHSRDMSPCADTALLEGMHRWVDRCNTGSEDDFIPLDVAGSQVGFVARDSAMKLAEWRDCQGHEAFTLEESGGNPLLSLSNRLSTASLQTRTAAVAESLKGLDAAGVIDGWRDELYPVTSRYGEDPVLLVERAAAPLLGIKGYGVHMNGYVRKNDRIYLWVATRSANKPTWPSQLDHIAAGGQPHGLGVIENMEKEAAEEAGIPSHLAKGAMATGAVSYTASYTYKSGAKGLKRDVLFVFDLELPEDFVPTAVDGEVEKFELVEAREVMHLVSTTDRYKDNCNLVLIDFFLRHGLLDPGARGYLDLVAGVRRGPLV